MIGSQLSARLQWSWRAPIALLTAILLLTGSFGHRVVGQGISPVELVSVTTTGVPGGGQLFVDAIPYDAGGPSHISADNRYVVFASPSDQIVVGDTNARQDIFLRDRQTKTTTLVSRAAGGGPTNDHSGAPVISGNGRFVAFVSLATDIVAGDTNGVTDVFVRDMQDGTTTRVSVSTGATPANFASFDPVISADGRSIAFVSYADNLVAGDTNVFNADVFLRDTVAGTTERVSLRPDGSEIVRADSLFPSISADGRRVAFGVYDNALSGPPPASTGPNFHHGIYVRDLTTASTILVSARQDGSPAELHYGLDPMISANGRYVSFTHWEDLDPSFPDALDEADGPYADVFVRDLQTSITDRVSLPFTGGPLEESGGRSSISGNGRYVAYVPRTGSLRVRDRIAGTTTVVSASGVTPDGNLDSPSISEDGQLVYFESYATNLVANDTNDLIDTFLFPLAPSADLSLTLTASPLQPAVNGSVTLVVGVANGGPSEATGVAIRTMLPAGLTYVSASGAGAYSSGTGIWSIGALASGATATLQIVGTFTASSPVSVTAQVSAASPPDPDSTPDNSDPTEDDQRTVLLTPAIADLSLTVTANSTSPSVNSNVTLTTSLTNGGPGLATGVGVRVVLPGSLTFVSATPGAGAYNSSTGTWTLASLPNGTTQTLQVVARVTATTEVDVVAQVSAANELDPDSTPNNSSAAEDDQGAVHLTPAASTGIVVNNATPAVNPTDGNCTLIEAIVAANTDAPSGNAIGECAGGSGADVIHLRALNPPYTFVAAHNTAHGPNALPLITSDITIDGAGAAIERLAGGMAGFRLFAIETTGRLVLDNTVVRNGSASTAGEGVFGGAIFNVGTLELNGSVVSNSVASCDGGGIFSSGPLVLRGGTTIQNNLSFCSGGGVGTFYAGSVTVDNSTIQLNAAPAGSGGGFYLHGTTTATMTASQVLNNIARIEGGGVFTHGPDANLSIANATIAGNSVSAGSGGGISNGRLDAFGVPFVLGGIMTLTNVSVAGNRVTGGYGGGIASASVMTITASGITDSQITAGAGCGAGIYNAAALALVATTVARNQAPTGSGGGVCSIGLGALTVTGSTINSNVAGGVGGGVALYFSPSAMFTNSTIASNSSAAGGGGIYSLNSLVAQTLVLDNTVLQQNSTNVSGGGLSTQSGTVTLRNNTRVLGNIAAGAGGGVVFNYGGAGSPARFVMNGGIIDGNTANGDWALYGGGGGFANLDLNPASVVALTDATVSNNHAPTVGDGGGIFNRGVFTMTRGAIVSNDAQSGGGVANGTSLMTGGPMTLSNVIVEGNVASSLGGGIFTSSPVGSPSAVTVVAGGPIRNNRAISGAGLFLRPNSVVDVTSGAIVSGNVATASGGGASNEGTLRINSATVSGNSADTGGAIYSQGPVTITAGTINGNRARIAAGIRAAASTIDIVNSTLSGNVASAAGAGAIQLTGTVLPDGSRSTRVNIRASTVVDNVGAPGGIGSQTGYLLAVANILAANRLPDGTVSECQGAGGSLWEHGGNLIGTDPACVMATGISNYTVDPASIFTAVVGPLADNGGPTATHALLPGSFAINAGDTSSPGALNSCPATDQRGEPRPRDGGDGIIRCDLGAVEQQTALPQPPPTLLAVTPQSGPAGAASATITATGAGFRAVSVARWNGAPRGTLVLGPTQLRITLLPGDLNTGSDLASGLITVANPDGTSSAPIPFAIVSTRVAAVNTQIAAPGITTTASALPAVAGQGGVSATLTNNTAGTGVATVSVATYSVQPVGTTVFAAGGFFDVQVTGADATDALTARFYYSSTITVAAEAGLQLQYWNGTGWVAVLGSGGAPPIKDTTNNLDGTTSGGRFTVTFDATSTPRITDLSGTVFAIVTPATTGPPVTAATESPSANAAGWHNTNVSVALRASATGSTIGRTEYNLDDRGWKTYSTPIPIVAEGIHTLRYRSTTTGGTIEATQTLTVRIDKTAPVLKLRVDPVILWPADGRLRNIEVDAVVKDGRSGGDGFKLISVDSNHRNDSGDIVGWTIGTPDTRGQLRAEFTGMFNPRIYLLTYKALDRAGNETIESELVWVLQIGGHHDDDRRH